MLTEQELEQTLHIQYLRRTYVTGIEQFPAPYSKPMWTLIINQWHHIGVQERALLSLIQSREEREGLRMTRQQWKERMWQRNGKRFDL